MVDKNRKLEGLPPLDDDHFVRQLMEEAGPRPAIPGEDLVQLSAVAHEAWRQKVAESKQTSDFRPRYAIAAMIAVALLGLLFWWNQRGLPLRSLSGATVEAVSGVVELELDTKTRRQIVPGESIPIGAVVGIGGDAARAGRAALRLRDGTLLRLDAGTRARFTAATSVELLQGALYADSSHGSGHGLEIHTAAGTARDIGTQFLVRLSGPEGALSVLVRQGTVAVTHGGQTFVTPSGHKLIVPRDGTPQLQTVLSHGGDWDWVLDATAGFKLEGRNLDQFLGWVAEETGWKIEYSDPQLAVAAHQIVLHGNMGKLRADRAPFLVLPGAGLEAELHDGTLVIKRAH